MGQSHRLREPVTPATGQRDLDGCLQAYPETLRDEHRFDLRLGAKHGADDLLIVREVRVIAFRRTGLIVVAYQSFLRASYRGYIENNPHVRCQSHAPGVSDALPVEDDTIRRLPQRGEGREQCGTLPEREQPRDIGEGGISYRKLFLDDAEGRVGEKDYGREEEIASLRVRYIGAGNARDLTGGVIITQDKLLLEGLLDGDCFPVRHVP